MSDLPYKIEYAKSGRAGCRKCGNGIAKETLRIAVMVQSFRHDGKDPHWHHLNCFFEKHRPKSFEDIENFESIRYDEQQEVKKKIESSKLTGISDDDLKKGKGKKRKQEIAAALKDFGIEYSVSSRATCPACEIKIMKDTLRVKHVVHDTEVAMRIGGQAVWHHLECFAAIRCDYDFYIGGENLPGFKSLSKSDKEAVKKILPAIKMENALKKMKGESNGDEETAAINELEEQIAHQTKKLFKYRDALKENLNKGQLQDILFVNGSEMVPSMETLLDRVADFMTFGAIAKCSVCKKGNFEFQKHGYVCNGNISEWAQCQHFEEKPKRKPCKIPKELKSSIEFLKSYQSKVRDRVVRPNIPKIKELKVKKENGDEEGIAHEPRIKRERPPFYNMNFVILGKTEIPKEKLKATIQKLGGKVGTALHDKITAVISNMDEIEKMNQRMLEVKAFDVHVVGENFVEEASKGNVIEKIKSMSICTWGSDPLLRIEQEVHKERESMYTKNVTKQVTMKLKGGTAVDPDSGISDIAHVYKDENKTLYTCVLGLTDIQKNKNSYYKLQVLESDVGKKYWLFKSWGRIGTKVGDSRLDTYGNASTACDAFETVYEEKTGNSFFNHKKGFKKQPGSYYPIDVDYDDKKVKKNAEKEKIPSKLSKPVQKLMKLLFDIDSMKRTMLEFDLDLEKMPLGKLSNKQLKEAYKTLTILNDLVASGAPDSKFIGESNKFYTLVPHSFGIKNPPVIDTLEMIKSKIDMVDSLMEIEIAYQLLNHENLEEINPIDAHYEQLKTELIPLKTDSDEFVMIDKYVQNTHATTHSNYTLEIKDVYKVTRQGEARRYKPFKKLENRQLLWHGSRLTNYIGILSHGLKIAPPEAPVTGYMFGKGIYFADMVSKSANYCAVNTKNNTGLLLLSEVALGKTHDLTTATYVTKLPKNTHSVKGIGKTQPNPTESITREDGVIVPLGKPLVDDKLRSDLLYNEYIVYDTAQVNIQYLLNVKFNFKK